jgi:hypothetical protein
MTNPLLQKYEELYGKKEPPKMPRIEDYEGEETFADELKKSNFIKAENAKVEIKDNSSGVICVKNFPPLVSYDKHSGNDAFLQIAEKVKNGTAQVTSVSLEVDAHGVFSYGKRITFEVYDYEP